jgi:hypothetical protein
VERPFGPKLAVENGVLETEAGEIEKIPAENRVFEERL